MSRLSDYTNAGVRKLKSTIDATEGQKIFPVVYIKTSNLEVYINGILLPQTEYTLSDNTTCTMDYALRAGDKVHFVELLLNSPST